MPRLSPVAIVAAGVLVVTACSSGSGAVPSAPLSFSVSAVEVQAVNQPAPSLPDKVRTKVLATLDAYADRATAAPLRSATPAGDLAAVFTSAALARVNGPDRAAMVDEGLPRASGLQPLASTAKLGALAGADNDITVVTATIDFRVQATGTDPVVIARSGDLVLVSDGGAWKIDGYDLSTARDSGLGPTTSTARK